MAESTRPTQLASMAAAIERAAADLALAEEPARFVAALDAGAPPATAPAGVTLTGLAAEIRAGRRSPVEVTQECLDRIARLDGRSARVHLAGRRGRARPGLASSRPMPRRGAGAGRSTGCRSRSRTCSTWSASPRPAARRPRSISSPSTTAPPRAGSSTPARSGSASSTWRSWPRVPSATTRTTATRRIRGGPGIARRLVERLRRGGGGGAGVGRAGHRHRRLHPAPRRLLRRGRAEADVRAREPRRRDGAVVVARPRRAAGADGAGCRAPARSHGGPGPSRRLRRAGAPCRTMSPGSPRVCRVSAWAIPEDSFSTASTRDGRSRLGRRPGYSRTWARASRACAFRIPPGSSTRPT